MAASMRRTLGLIAFAASVAIAPAAWAQGAPNPEAVKHFLEGKRLRDENRCVEALVELEASLRIEKSIGAHYNYAVCSEKIGNKRAALQHYTEALELARARQDDRLREIRAQLSEFLEKTPHVRLALPQPIPTGLRITVDGDLVPPEDLHTETKYFPKTDKPTYEVQVTAPGYEDTRLTVERSAIRNRDLVQVVLRRPSETAPPAPGPKAEEGGFTWQHWTGIAGIVVGAAGMTFTIASAVSYNIKKNKLEDQFNQACRQPSDPAPACTDTERADQTRIRSDYDANEASAERRAPVWIGLGVGGVLVAAGGIVLLVTAPPLNPKEAPAPQGVRVQVVPSVGVTHQGMSLVGTF